MARLLALGELMRRSRCVAMVVALCFVCLSAAQAQQRVALVIGNGAYTGEAALPNAVRDAELVAEGFTSLGFRVTLHRNLDQAGLKRALQDFEVKAEGAEVAAIYFAGHGIAVDGRNWMLPVDAKLASARHVDDEAVSHTRFIAAVDGAKGLQIVILDACRNNPFAPRLARQAGARNVGVRGLEPIPDRELPPNRLVAFSARDGQVAQDGAAGSNGPYATALRRRMAERGTEIGLLFRRVRDDVVAATRNTQEPWAYSSLGGKELFLGSAITEGVPQVLQQQQTPPPPAPPDECDRLAQPPRNGMGRVPSFAEGVEFDRMDGAAALTACEQAAQRYPYEVRFVFFLGRASARLGRDDEAARLYRLAADQGFAPAKFGLGIMYANGRGVAKSDAEAVRLYREAAEYGLAGAQLNLGAMYGSGRGVAQNNVEAVRFYRLAADQGDARAQHSLGQMYENGLGVEENDVEAARLFRLAANQGYAGAQYSLGFMYEEGRGNARNDSEAVRLYRLASDQGDASAQNNLGVMYEQGRAVAKNDVEAVRLYRLAANQGRASAQTNLGRMYEYGRGVAKNMEEATQLYRLAARQGNSSAQAALRRLGQTW